MARRHFNEAMKPDFALIVSDIEAALSRRDCALIEVYVVGGYARALSQGAQGLRAGVLRTLVARIEKTCGDVDILVGYRPSREGIEVGAKDLAFELNDGVDEAGPNGKNFLIDLWISPEPIVPRPGALKVYPDVDLVGAVME
jgi:hypothetical protein